MAYRISAANVTGNMAHAQLTDKVHALLEYFDESLSWRHVVPGASNSLQVVMQQSIAGFTVLGGDVLISALVFQANIPMITIPVLKKAREQLVIHRGAGAADVWTYITVSRGDTDNILRSSTWTLNGFRGKDTSVVFLASKRTGGKEPRQLQLLLENEPSPALPSSELPSYASSIPVHGERHRAAAATHGVEPSSREPAGQHRDGLAGAGQHDGPTLRTRAHHKATAVQPWDAADDGTEKWEPEWTSRERRHLRAIRSPPDSLRPLTSPYRVPSPGEPVSSGQGSSSPEVTPESAQDLAEHIGAFLRSLDTGGDFRGQGLEDQKIYIGGFTTTRIPVDEVENEARGSTTRPVLEVLVYLKGVWRTGDVDRIKHSIFVLPGGELDPQQAYVRTVHRAGFDKWTFSSRTGRKVDEANRLVATAWTMEPGSDLTSKGLDDTLYVTFALDEPHRVRARHARRGHQVEVFALGRGAERTGTQREGGVF